MIDFFSTHRTKVVFIDIDGVVAPTCRTNPAVVAAHALDNLKRIVVATDAKVVLASSWPEEEARTVLATHSIPLHTSLGPRRNDGDYGRAREVRRFVCRYRIRQWVWIDNDPFPRSRHLPNQTHLPWAQRVRYPYPLAPEHYVQTTWHVRHCVDGEEVDGEGLSAEVADRVIAILNEPTPLEEQIEKTTLAIRRADEQIDVDFPWRGPPTDCCMRCAHGDPYRDALKAQARRVRWLIELIKKRKHVPDRKLLEQLRERLRELG